MSKIEEIERAVEKLPLQDFVKLAAWVDQRRQQLQLLPPAVDNEKVAARDHSAFLNSYSLQPGEIWIAEIPFHQRYCLEAASGPRALDRRFGRCSSSGYLGGASFHHRCSFAELVSSRLAGIFHRKTFPVGLLGTKPPAPSPCITHGPITQLCIVQDPTIKCRRLTLRSPQAP